MMKSRENAIPSAQEDDEVDEHQTPHGTQKNTFCSLQKEEEKIRSIIL